MKNKKPTAVRALALGSRGAAQAQRAVGVFQTGDLEDPKKFSKKLPLARRYGGLVEGQEREAWEWRAHALRVGQKPLALFVWLMNHPGQRKNKITGEDERAAGKALQRAQHAKFAEQAKQTRGEEYERYLHSSAWYRLRIAKLREQKYTCQDCKIRLPRRQLEVHHERYPALLGKEKLEDLRALCGQCHDRRHSKWSRSS